jgi:mycothione reductase
MSSVSVVDGSAHPAPSPASHHFDLVVIGTGSGNSLISDEMNGWKIAIVEEAVFGGTCLNRGCIPTKMFVHTADMAENVRHAHQFGVDASVDSIRWKDIRDRVFSRIDPIAEGGRNYRTNQCENVTVFAGRGNFVGERMITVTPADGSPNVTITGERVVVAVGARPHLPFIPGLTEVGFHTSDSIMRIDELPKHLVIVGGGFIASEFCHVFASFGVRITMVVRGEALLRDHDHDIAHAFTAQVAARANVDVKLSTTPTSVAKTTDGLAMTLSDGSIIDGDALLLATGRIPNSDTVSAAQGGMKIHPDGRIVVDMFQQTTAAGVWALGDVSSPHQLKHVANHEARVVRQHLLDPSSSLSTDHRFVPAAVFTRPQIATVGLTERAARDAGIDIMVKTQMFGDVAYGWAMEDTTSICKLIADRTTRKLIGVHIMGPSASNIVQQLIQGMTFGQTIDEMAHGQYYIHPALPEVIENALLGLK